MCAEIFAPFVVASGCWIAGYQLTRSKLSSRTKSEAFVGQEKPILVVPGKMVKVGSASCGSKPVHEWSWHPLAAQPDILGFPFVSYVIMFHCTESATQLVLGNAQ